MIKTKHYNYKEVDLPQGVFVDEETAGLVRAVCRTAQDNYSMLSRQRDLSSKDFYAGLVLYLLEELNWASIMIDPRGQTGWKLTPKGQKALQEYKEEFEETDGPEDDEDE